MQGPVLPGLITLLMLAASFVRLAQGIGESCNPSGTCTLGNGCSVAPGQGDCASAAEICCPPESLQDVGSPCLDNDSTFGRCTQPSGCSNALATSGECKSGLVCCPTLSLPDTIGDSCSFSDNETAICHLIQFCMAVPVSTCAGASSDNLYCCSDNPDVGDQCSDVPGPGLCAIPDHCDTSSSPAIGNPCDQGGVCCPNTNLPGLNQSCGKDFANQGTCVTISDCTFDRLLAGITCSDNLRCCKSIKDEGDDCKKDDLTTDGVCTAMTNCIEDDMSNQGNCNDGLHCCVPPKKQIGEACDDDGGAPGICVNQTICDSDDATMGDCDEQLKCCAMDDVEGYGDCCASGAGNCLDDCSTCETYDASSCENGFVCCVNGLNTDCSYDKSKGGAQGSGVCKLPKDCKWRRYFRHQHQHRRHRQDGRGSCPNRHLVCCPDDYKN